MIFMSMNKRKENKKIAKERIAVLKTNDRKE